MKRGIHTQALEALETLLRQVSAVKVRHIGFNSLGPHQRKDILARIDVYGRDHTLFCRVKAGGEARDVRVTLRELRRTVPDRGAITPVLIAPRISGEAMALCREGQLSFLDLDGNAHLELPEYFFARACSMGHATGTR